MALVPRPHPAALPHGNIVEVAPKLHFVKGTVAMSGPLPIRFSRNMTIIQEGERLVLVNTVRLDEPGLAALDALGKVTDIIRLAGFHGSDDPFYRDRYKAKLWAIKGQRYTAGFNTRAPDVYAEPDVEVDASTKLPVEGAKMHIFESTPPEGVLWLERSGGTCITGDCLQHWHVADEYFSWIGSLMMKLMGFIKPHNVGPGWLKQAKPTSASLRALLDLPFANVLPAHGAAVVGGARDHFRPAVERAIAARA